jgi:hypothetical protein
MGKEFSDSRAAIDEMIEKDLVDNLKNLIVSFFEYHGLSCPTYPAGVSKEAQENNDRMIDLISLYLGDFSKAKRKNLVDAISLVELENKILFDKISSEVTEGCGGIFSMEELLIPKTHPSLLLAKAFSSRGEVTKAI